MLNVLLHAKQTKLLYSVLGLQLIFVFTPQDAYAVQVVNKSLRVFEVDYENKQFLKDGEPFRYISGSVHYFRVPRVYWRDRLRKLRAAGLNTVSTYIEWSLHEPKPGTYDFEGEKDVVRFIEIAQEEGLLVILRPGPYINSERDMGGFPPWLLYESPNIVLRSNDPSYTKFVNSWFKLLFPRLQPLFYGNGGPVILVQVENEFGSYVNKPGIPAFTNYTLGLRDLFHGYVNDKAVLFTTDGSLKDLLDGGMIPGVFATVDFFPGGNASEEFRYLREYQHGPLVNSEFYPGWLTIWGDDVNHTVVSVEAIVNTTKQLLMLNASFNYYVFHGGTNYGLSTGADTPSFHPVATTYDFQAPISECGELTEKYYAIKAAISEFLPVPDIQLDLTHPADYGTITLEPKISLFEAGGVLLGEFLYPQTFEALQLYSGLMLYETTLPSGYNGSGDLVARGVHDRALVYVNRKTAGVLSRTYMTCSSKIKGQAGQSLRLLVENQGHVAYGNMTDMADFKGLVENVTLNGEVLKGWNHTGYSLTTVPSIVSRPGAVRNTTVDPLLPGYFSGTLRLPNTETTYQDTFVDMAGWGKGVLYVNGRNLGRYWPGEGPQVTLFCPGSILQTDNTITVFELESQSAEATVTFRNHPIFIYKNHHRL